MTETYDPQRSQDRPTEDDIAQAELGGVKGSPKLPPAPLTKQEAEQMLPNDEPGHVARGGLMYRHLHRHIDRLYRQMDGLQQISFCSLTAVFLAALLTGGLKVIVG